MTSIANHVTLYSYVYMYENAQLTKSRTCKLAIYIAMRRLLAMLIIMGSLVADSNQENMDDQQGNTEDPMMQETIEETNQAMSSSGEVPVSEFYSKCVLIPV